MKRLITFVLLLTLMFSLASCAASNALYAVDNIDALKEEVDAAWKSRAGSSTRDLRYYGSFNGYHIVEFVTTDPYENAVTTKNIAGYKFKRNTSFYLMTYKDGVFIKLEDAYQLGLISEEAIAKASGLSAEKKDATK